MPAPFLKNFEIPLLHKVYFETSMTHREKLYRSTQAFINSYMDFIDVEKAHAFQINDPKVIIGDIASGDQFISDTIAAQTCL